MFSANYQNLTINGGGNKTLTGATSVANTLTLSNGLLVLGNLNLTINNAVAGTPSNTAHVVTNGTGQLLRNLNNPTAATAQFPVGTGGTYAPVSVNVTATGTGTLGFRTVGAAVTAPPASTTPNLLNRHWVSTSTGLTYTTFTPTFTYANAEAVAAEEVNYVPAFAPGGVAPWQIGTTAQVNEAADNFSLVPTSLPAVAGIWTAGLPANFLTYYSRQTGNWENTNTWSIIGHAGASCGCIPPAGAAVIVGNSHTVTATAATAKNLYSLQIDNASTLALGTFGNAFTINILASTGVGGNGTLSTANANAPTITTNNFATSNGTVVFGNGTYNLWNWANFPNVVVNGAANTDTKTVTANTVVNGNFTLNRGVVDFGTTARVVTIVGNLAASGANTREFNMRNTAHSLNLAGANNDLNTLNNVTNSTVSYYSTLAQQIFDATYDNLIVTGGATKTLTGGNVTVNANLGLNGAVLEVANQNLILANAATYTNGVPLSNTNMVQTSGTGYFRKNLANNLTLGASSFTFTLPIGSGGVYAPVGLAYGGTSTTNNTGQPYVQGRTVNAKLPANAPVFTTAQTLSRYWVMDDDQISTLSYTGTFTYDNSEADTGAEASYIGARLNCLYTGAACTGALPWRTNGTVNAATNVITLPTIGASDYTVTAGPIDAFSPPFYSLANGNWTDPNSWSQVGYAGPASPIAPPTTGARVFVGNNRTITLDAAFATTTLASLQIDATGTLDLNGNANQLSVSEFPFFSGTLSGSGTIRQTAAGGTAWMPNTNIDASNTFGAGNTGTVVFYGNANYNLPRWDDRDYPNLRLTGTGTKTTANDLIVNGTLTVDGGTFTTDNNDRTLTIAGGAVVNNTGNWNLSRFNLTVQGPTTVNNGGRIFDNNDAQTHRFYGLLTVNAGGTFDPNSDSGFRFRNGITNAGTFNMSAAWAATGQVIFETNAQTITPLAPMTFNKRTRFNVNTTLANGAQITFSNDLHTINNDIAVTNNNTAGAVFNGQLNGGNGNSTWLNNDNSLLIYRWWQEPMATGILDVDQVGNTVDYNGNGWQSVRVVASRPYYNLIFSNTGTRDWQDVDMNILNDFTVRDATVSQGMDNVSLETYIGGNLLITSTAATPFNTTNGQYFFTGANKTISSTTLAAINFPRVAFTGSYALPDAGSILKTLNVNTYLGGGGSLQMPTNGVLNFSGTNIDMSVGGLDVMTNQNTTVNYNRNGDQLIFPINYQNLVLRNGGIKRSMTHPSLPSVFTVEDLRVRDNTVFSSEGAGYHQVDTASVGQNATFESVRNPLYPLSTEDFSDANVFGGKFDFADVTDDAGNEIRSLGSTNLSFTRVAGSLVAARGTRTTPINTNFSPEPLFLQLQTDITVTSITGAQNNAARFYLGPNFANDHAEQASYGRLQMDVDATSGWRLSTVDGTALQGGWQPAGTPAKLTWVVNRTAAPRSYVPPSGPAVSLPANRMDVYLGNTLIFSGLVPENAANIITDFKFWFFNGQATINLDNLRIDNLINGRIFTNNIRYRNSPCTTPGGNQPINIAVDFRTSADAIFNVGNIFTAQLSNASGSFAAPVNLGTLSLNNGGVPSALLGSINATLPAGTGTGNGYRIRVISSNNPINGVDNAFDIRLNTGTVLTNIYPAEVQTIGETSDTGAPMYFPASAGIRRIEWGYQYVGLVGNTMTPGPFVPFSVPTSQDSLKYTPNSIHFPQRGEYRVLARVTLCNGATTLSNATTIYVNCKSGANLVVNGDFSNGTAGFTSEYQYVTGPENVPGQNMYPEGTWSVNTNPRYFHVNFCNALSNTDPDGSKPFTGTNSSPSGGQMLIANGATPVTGGIRAAWRQTVIVRPNTDYTFSFWAATLNDAGPEENLQFGVYFGCEQVGAPIRIRRDQECTWKRYAVQWRSPNNPAATYPIELSIRNDGLFAGGNDFALDDVEFFECTGGPFYPFTPPYVWLGANSDWFDPRNWGNCFPPDCGDEVTIPAVPELSPAGTPIFPILDRTFDGTWGNAVVKSVTIEPGARLTINPGITLRICDDFINNGNFTADPTSTVRFVYDFLDRNISGNFIGANAFGNVVVAQSEIAQRIPELGTTNDPRINFAGATGIYDPATNSGPLVDAGNGSTNPVKQNPDVVIQQDINIISGDYTMMNTRTMWLGRHFTNSSRFTANQGLVEFNGTGDQEFRRTGTGSFYNMRMNQAAVNNLYLFHNATVTNQLNLTRGRIRHDGGAGARLLDVTNNAPNAVINHSANSYVVTTFPDNNNRLQLRRAINGAAGAARSYDFPVGTDLGPKNYQLAQLEIPAQLTGVSTLNGFFSDVARAGTFVPGTPANCTFRPCGGGFWNLTPDAQPTGASSYNVQVFPTGFNCQPTPNCAPVPTILKADNGGTNWGFAGSTSSGVHKRNGYTAFSDFVIAEEEFSILPVEFASFTATPVERTTLLNWTTAWELNNAHFVVEHSLNGQTWTEIGQVAGRGTTSSRQAYDFVHQEPQMGLNYYRLRQVDTDGTTKYSRIVSVSFNGQQNQRLVVYPNPSPRLEVSLLVPGAKGEAIVVDISDVTGRSLFRGRYEQAGGPIRVSDPGLPLSTGVYLVRVSTSAGKNYVEKLVIE